jgi:hypothetical protein
MYKSIFEKISPELRKSDQAAVCIVGPGLDTMDAKMPTCPQAAELLSIFPKANFLLLDNDKEVLERLNKYRTLKMLPYDSFALRMRTMPVSNDNTKNEFLAPESYLKIFEEMAASFGDLASYPPNAKAMLLENKDILDRVMLKLDQEKFEVRDFDIGSSEFLLKDKQFDVIVATLSLGNPISGLNGKIDKDKDLAALAKFLSKLKLGGILYIDIASYSQIVGVDIDYLKLVKLIGYQIKTELVSVKDFMENFSGEMGMLESFYRHGEHRMCVTSTASVVAITKLDLPFPLR